MKKLFFLSAFSAVAVCCFAQQRAIEIENQPFIITDVSLQAQGYAVCGTTAGYTPQAAVIKYDAQGNVQFARAVQSSFGRFRSIADAGDGNYLVLAETYNYEYVLLKLSPAGSELWRKFIAKSMEDDYFQPMLETDADGNIYLLNSVMSSIQLYKLNSGGNLEWTKTLATNGFNGKNPGLRMKVTTGGNIICTGKAENDVLYICVTPGGEVEWTKRFSEGGIPYTRAYQIIEKSDGGFLMTGMRMKMDVPMYVVTSQGFFLLETDASGNIESFNEYMLPVDTSGSNGYWINYPFFTATEIVLNPDGSKDILGDLGNYDMNGWVTVVGLAVHLDANNEITSSSYLTQATLSYTNKLQPRAADGNRLIFTDSDTLTGVMYLNVTTPGNLPACNMEPAELYVRQAVNISSGNISSQVEIEDAGYAMVTNGTFPVTSAGAITHKEGCTAFTGVRDAAALPALACSPNPASDMLQVECAALQTGNAHVYDLSGKQLFHQAISGSKNMLDVSALAPGMYVLLLQDAARQSQRVKFVKE